MCHLSKLVRSLLPVLLFLLSNVVLAAPGGDSSLLDKINAQLAAAGLPATGNANITSHKFATLDKYVDQQVFSVVNIQNDLDKNFFERFNNDIDTSIQAWRARAANAANEVEQANTFVDYLQPSDIQKLPVGFKKKLGTNSYLTIAVSSAVFQPKYAELTVFARLKIPQMQTPIFFGVTGLKLSYNGGIIGKAKLILLGDVAIPINGGNAALILKGGGFNTTTGLAGTDDKTYITLDCKGFKELGLTADIKFPRSLIVPVKPDGNPDTANNVMASITNLKISDWNDIIATVSFNKPFQLRGLNGFVFTVNTAAFDFSDLRNNPDIIYPAGYQDKYLQKDILAAWRGVYVKELSLSLPKAFKDRERPNEQLSFGVNDLLIDNNGITGVFFAENVLPINRGNAAGWKFSVDSIRLAIEANRITRAGFGGKLGLPVNKIEPGTDTASKRKYFEYSASISMGGDYVCKVVTKDEMDFDVFRAKVVLLPNSFVQFSGNADHFDAEATLNGKIGIVSSSLNDAPETPGRNPIADMKGIEFKGMHISSKAPHFSLEYAGYQGEVKFGNFPVSFDNIGLQSLPGDGIALAFGVRLNLGDSSGGGTNFSGKTAIRVIGASSSESGGILNWKFSKIQIDAVEIHANVKNSFTLDGFVKFFDDTIPSSRRYGRGFEGGIKATFKALKDADIQVRALFAKAPTFRYWYVDGKVDFGTGIPIGPALKLRGFGGGAYFRMKKDPYSGVPDDFSPTGIPYSADSTAGLGVKASLLFNVGAGKAISGEASFEMAFNKGGGLKYIGFFGMVKVSEDVLPAVKSVSEFLTNKIKSVEKYVQDIGPTKELDLIKLKSTNPTDAAKKQNEGSDGTAEKPGESGLAAYIGISYDFNSQTLHANFDLFIKAAGGLLTGIGEGNRAGWAVFHSEPGKWYFRAGTPKDPIGIKFGIGSFYLKTTAYLMLGDDMPAFPPPPKQVLDILAESGLQYTSPMSQGDLSGGRGIAFGAGLQMATGDLRFLIFYANFSAGLGFDVMLKDYGNAHCEGSSGKIGINGWYAQGQAYAYLQGELGLKIKLLFVKKNIVLIKGGAAALLQARLPNPTWVGGAVGFYVNILGGLVKGHFNFKFSFGNDCKIVADGTPTEEELSIIEEVKPENGSDLSLLTNPTIKFRIKPGAVLEIPLDDGSGNDYYKPNLDAFKLYKGTVEVAGSIQYNEEGDIATFKPDAVLDPKTEYKIVANVSFQKMVNGQWVTYTDNGQRVEEKKTFTFTTGEAPVALPAEFIKRLYPFYNQRNFYKDEQNKGIIRLNKPFASYFANFKKWKIKVETLDGAEMGTVYATTDGSLNFYYSFPANLLPNTSYNFFLWGEGANSATLDTAKPSLKLTFTTSGYPTLAAKINALQTTQPIVGRVSSDVIDLQAAVADYEGFELYELAGNQYTENVPMIQGEADVTGETYYNEIIKLLLYPNSPQDNRLADGLGGYVTISNPEYLKYGLPPFNAVTPSWYYINSLQSTDFTSLLKTRMPFVHNTNKYFNLHYLDYRSQLVNRYLNQGGIRPDTPQKLKDIMEKGFPFIIKGFYKARFSLVQYDGTKGPAAIFTYENPIE